jgi:DNA repair exonuclease SbcCD ATPase subunit
MDIEEDIEKVKKLNNLLKFFKTHGWIPNMSRNININGTIEAIEHILAEREEDKKRIKELEVLEDDLKDKRIVYVDTPEFEEKFISKQKVKENIEKIKDRFNKNFSNKKDKAYFGIAGVNHILDILEKIIGG